MFCPKCGKEIDDNAKFCGFCGNKISIEEISDNDVTRPKSSKNSKKIIIFVLSIVMIGIIVGVSVSFLIPMISGDKNDDAPNNENFEYESADDSSSDDNFDDSEEENNNTNETEQEIPETVPVASESWTVLQTSEEIAEINALFPISDNMNPVFKYTWSSHNVLTLALDATFVFQSLFSGLDMPYYISQNDIEFISEIELQDAAGKCVAMGYYIPAEYAEETLAKNAESIFGIDKEDLRSSSYYNKDKNAYLYQTGLGGADTSGYEIEKIVLYENYAFVYQRLWSDYNPDTKRTESYGPRSNGCVTILMHDIGEEKYHFVSNFAVKDIDTVLDNTFYSSFAVLEPEENDFTKKYISYVTAGSGLRIRTGPGEDYDSIITIPLDAPVLCLAERDGWIYVRYNTVYGWMSSEYLVLDNPSQ